MTGEGGMIWENGIETCVLPYVKRIASLGSMHETECLGLVHWDDPEGWDGEGGGREGSGWGTHLVQSHLGNIKNQPLSSPRSLNMCPMQ